jgi:hypothetical protein
MPRDELVEAVNPLADEGDEHTTIAAAAAAVAVVVVA